MKRARILGRGRPGNDQGKTKDEEEEGCPIEERRSVEERRGWKRHKQERERSDVVGGGHVHTRRHPKKHGPAPAGHWLCKQATGRANLGSQMFRNVKAGPGRAKQTGLSASQSMLSGAFTRPGEEPPGWGG